MLIVAMVVFALVCAGLVLYALWTNEKLTMEIDIQQEHIDYLKDVCLPQAQRREEEWKQLVEQEAIEHRITRMSALELLRENERLKKQASNPSSN